MTYSTSFLLPVMMIVWSCCTPTSDAFFAARSTTTATTTTTATQRTRSSRWFPHASLLEPTDSNFGRKEYWNDFYKNSDNAFSWYSGWDDLEPFIRDLIPNKSASSILIPGVGNDPLLRDMYDDGYQHMTAFDYVPEGVQRARALLGESRPIPVVMADARALPPNDELFLDHAYDAVLEKGTLDAIYLSGGKADKARGAQHLQQAVKELARVIKPGGVFISITAACLDAVQAALENELSSEWTLVRDGSFFTTEDGYTSNNIDGTLFAWVRNNDNQIV